MKRTDAVIIASKWPYTDSCSERYIEFVIDNMTTVCVRDDSRALVGWMLQYTSGAMGMLHVLDGHRRLGLGKYMVQKLCRKLLDKGETAYSYIPLGNTASEKLHESVGFRKADDTFYWYRTFCRSN